MSEQTNDPTTASDLNVGGDKPGTDYGSPSGIGGTGDEEHRGGSDPGGDGEAVPDEPSAEAAQAGVQDAFN